MEKWQDPEVIALWIAIAVIMVFTILFFVIWILYTGYKRMTEVNLREARTALEHQKKLLETNLHAQEKERERIAADLHDSLIGKLTVVRMKSQLGAAAADVEEMLGESIAEARRISHDLTPPLIEFSTIEELISNLLDPWEQKLTIDYYRDVRTLTIVTPQVKIQVLRIMQELITNIVKHAHATTVTVHLRHTKEMLILRVQDNGRGFDVAQLKAGLGLQSLEMRAQYLNAAHHVKSTPGKGTRILVAAPLNTTA
jgi:two-component system NarL family sensor kinase